MHALATILIVLTSAVCHQPAPTKDATGGGSPAVPASPPSPPKSPTPGPKDSANPAGEVFTPPDNPRFPADKLAPSKFEKIRNESGEVLRIDGKYVVRGKGTKSEPYVVPFDLLASAENTYKPRLGLSKLPQRVTFLDGAYIKIEGFTAFPITSTDPKEMLVMQNQWDGCCIGTPPTPYDAVEVALAKGVSQAARKAGHGAVSGKFKVDPYDDNGWLLGLYLMDEGEVDAGK